MDYLLAARRGYHGVLHNLIKIYSKGLLTLENVCGDAGLAGVPYRDGSFEYYVSEKIILPTPKARTVHHGCPRNGTCRYR